MGVILCVGGGGLPFIYYYALGLSVVFGFEVFIYFYFACAFFILLFVVVGRNAFFCTGVM